MVSKQFLSPALCLGLGLWFLPTKPRVAKAGLQRKGSDKQKVTVCHSKCSKHQEATIVLATSCDHVMPFTYLSMHVCRRPVLLFLSWKQILWTRYPSIGCAMKNRFRTSIAGMEQQCSMLTQQGRTLATHLQRQQFTSLQSRLVGVGSFAPKDCGVGT